MQSGDARPAGRPAFPSGVLYVVAVLLLFLIVHFTGDRIASLADAVPALADSKIFHPKSEWMVEYLPSLKGLGFLASLLILSVPLFKDLRSGAGSSILRDGLKPYVIPAVTVLVLGFLVFQPGSRSLGADYARIARDPFDQPAGIYNTRLLMPALAHILFLRGNWLYYGFSILLTIVFLTLLHAWLKEHCPLPFWQFLSLATCSFVIFQFQYGGYPDILVFTFFLLVMRKETGQPAKLSLLLLALIAHESSVFLGAVLAWRYLDRRYFTGYLFAVAAYTFIWFGSAGFDLQILVDNHDVRGESGLSWLMRSPDREMFGIAAAYKALWILLAAGLYLALRRRRFPEAGFISGALGAAILMSVLAVDTSRLMGFAFPGLLAALAVIAQTVPEKRARLLFSAVFLLNLILPSVYVGSNTGVEWSPGLYSAVFQGLFP